MNDTSPLHLLKYPIGLFKQKDSYSGEELNNFLKILEDAPDNYRKTIHQLKPDDLRKTYREGGWNILQLVHHVADIHLLHFLRMKKALTESESDSGTVIIDMDGWAKTPDVLDAPVEDSLLMFDGINRRYVQLLRTLDEAALEISYFHPVRNYRINQAQAMAMSAWHVNHHLAHIKIALGMDL